MLAAAIFPVRSALAQSTASSLTQYGITWTFDNNYTYGQFANGDYWVVGPLTITNISPGFSGTTSGWDVNPLPSEITSEQSMQGYDTRTGDYFASDRPSLPYLAQPGSSIVTTIGNEDAGSGVPYLQTAAVLTVVASPPPNNGATVFRPPYVGSNKPYYSTTNIQWSLLPSLVPPPSVTAVEPSLSGPFNGVDLNRVQLDHLNGEWNNYEPDYSGVVFFNLDPANNVPEYGPNVENAENQGILRLFLNDSVAAKTPLMIAVIQGGIDRYYALLNGQFWPAGSGMDQGRKFPIAFAGAMLNDASMMQAVTAPITPDPVNAPYQTFSDFFNEDGMVVPGIYGQGLFDGPSSESYYSDARRQ